MKKKCAMPNDGEESIDHLEFHISRLQEDAATMHEMFVSFVEAGFTENQALKLVSLLVQPEDESIVAFYADPEVFDEDEGDDA